MMKGLYRYMAPLVVALAPLAATAVEPGQHPYYLHALSDLRTARVLIEQRGGDTQMST